MVNDRIADMLTRIRNANQMKYDTVEVLSSKMTLEIANILKTEGYISDYKLNKNSNGDTISEPSLSLLTELPQNYNQIDNSNQVTLQPTISTINDSANPTLIENTQKSEPTLIENN